MNKTRMIGALLTALLVCGSFGCSRDDTDGAKHASSADEAFCVEHQIAEAQCPFCDPSLLVSLGFCGGHGVPEALCYQCNPDLIPAFKAVGDWCAGHDRPESQCYICNPELDPARKKVSSLESAEEEPLHDGFAAVNAATTRDIPRSQQPPSVYCTTQNLLVRFDSPDIAAEAGFQFAAVTSRQVTKTVECMAVVAYDGNRYAHLAAQVPGIVAEVHKDLGDRVEPGDALATITSTHLGAAEASYLQAVAAVGLWERNHAREADLLERGVSTEKDLFEAETRLAENRISLSQAQQALLSLGLSSEQIDGIGHSDHTSGRYIVTSSLPGVIVERNAVSGEVVDRTKSLFAIADVSRMWALLDVYEYDLREIRVGQPVVLRVAGLPGETFGGHITWVSSQLDPRTRTLQARAELDNSRGLLRANMFAQASVTVRDRVPALVVPEAAVQWEGCCNVVFVKKDETVYEPRKVHLGVSTGTLYEVLGGVDQGEQVVTQGSFLLKTELLKGSIGAGCCETQPGT